MPYQIPKIGAFPFRIVGEAPIEETNMSQTWLAVTTGTDQRRQVVIKIAARRNREYFSRNQDAITIEERWLKHLQARAHHAGIVELISVVPQARNPIYSGKTSDPGEPRFIVLGYLAGGTLKEFLGSSRRLPTIYALHIAKKLSESIAFVHAQGCVHMDIKPDNVMFQQPMGTGTTLEQILPVLIDFGIARDGGREEYVGGVDTWLAPECVQAKRNHIRVHIAPAMDIYALGLLLYYMVTGQHPRELTHNAQGRRKITPELLGNVAPAVAQQLDALVGAMLHTTPDQRPQASHVTRTLDQLMKQFAPVASAVPTRPIFRLRGLAIGAVASVLVAAMAFVLISFAQPTGEADSGLSVASVPAEGTESKDDVVTSETDGATDVVSDGATDGATEGEISATNGDSVAVMAPTETSIPDGAASDATGQANHNVAPAGSESVAPQPTFTKVPTREPTATPEATAEPTPSATPESASPEPANPEPANPEPAPTATAGESAPGQALAVRQVTIFSPPEEVSSNGKVNFRWAAGFELADSERFEVAYWDPALGDATVGQQSAYGFGPATTEPFLEVDLEQYNRFYTERFASGRTYQWAVRICLDASCSDFQWVSEPRSIRYELSSSDPAVTDGSGG